MSQRKMLARARCNEAPSFHKCTEADQKLLIAETHAQICEEYITQLEKLILTKTADIKRLLEQNKNQRSMLDRYC